MTEENQAFGQREQFMTDYREYASAMESFENKPIYHAQSWNSCGYDNRERIFQPVNNQTVRSDFNYNDYSYYRPSDSASGYMEGIIGECMEVYRREPIIHQVIDLMSDFGSKGIRIIAADKRQERFGKQWSEYIGLTAFADRFLNVLYRCGTVVVKRTDGKVPTKIEKKWKSVSTAQIAPGSEPKQDVNIEVISSSKTNLPLKWTIYDPRSVVMVGGLLSNFVGRPIFGLRINAQLQMELAQLPKLAANNGDYEYFQSLIPQYVRDAVGKGSQYFPLDQSKIYAYYYKKDDWELWGKPIIEPILRAVRMYNKLQLADMAALDGAISSVRLWRLGSMEHGVVPTPAMLERLRDALTSIGNGGTADFVYGPDLDFKESDTNLHQFLGPSKYEATLSAIYAGLGVPPGLTGSSSSSSFTNNYVGLKTLVERLEYGRNILISFLNEQLKLVQTAMGFKKPFRVVFDQMVLSDEAAHQKLLLDLWDRDLVSDETIRYTLNLDESDIEETKIARQAKKRGKRLPEKASPYHSPMQKHELTKIFANQGNHSASEFGIDLAPKKEGEEGLNETKKKLGELKARGGTGGRPLNARDSTQRKQRRVLPKGASASYSDLFLFAEQAREVLDEKISSHFLKEKGKKNIRSLTVEENEELSSFRFNALCCVKPFSKIEDYDFSQATQDEDINNVKQKLEYEFFERYGRKPNISEIRKLECESYANVFSDFING